MRLTDHFTSDEIGWQSLPAALRPNALATVALLEELRGAIGVPLRVTSLYRAPARNATVGGAVGSQHLDATAADVVPLGVSYAEAWRRATASPTLRQRFGQLIGYASGSHLHVALPTRGKLGEVLWATEDESGATSYAAVAPSLPLPDVWPGIPAEARLLVAALLVGGVLLLAD